MTLMKDIINNLTIIIKNKRNTENVKTTNRPIETTLDVRMPRSDTSI